MAQRVDKLKIAVVKKGIQPISDNLKKFTGIDQAQPGKKAPVVVEKVTVKPAVKPAAKTIGKIASIITKTPKQMGGELKEVTIKGTKTAPVVKNMFKNKGEADEYDYNRVDSVARKHSFFPDEFKINPKLTARENRIKIENAINSRSDLSQQMKNFLK